MTPTGNVKNFFRLCGKEKTAGEHPAVFTVNYANCSGRSTPQILAMKQEKEPRSRR